LTCDSHRAIRPDVLDPDPAACKLSVTATTKRGDLLASATLDPNTNIVTGTLRASGAREGVPLTGFRDVGPPVGKHASCVTPGVYELVVPAEQAWSSDAQDRVPRRTIRRPALDRHARCRRHGAWGAEDVFEVGPCAVEVRFRHHEQTAYTQLAFAGDKVTANATSASMRVVSKGGDAGRCSISGPMAWVERRPQ
jgi:hypothetical protein